MHLAAEANEARIIDILVARDANVNAFNVRHQLPLHIAVEAGLGLVAEVLIVAGASLEEKEKTGKSSLYLAARGGFVTLVDMIVKAERQVKSVEVCTFVSLRLPLHIVAFAIFMHDSLLRTCISFFSCIRYSCA